ncbi:MAG: glycoside hydrolase family protein [Alphaproteobacteria bacterium]|nr:glycoside hydrolase family protein [Alphaproteobacteria bacterium]MBQ9235127.1 glycoside hydrolase family protein [Alphaproteobacteria bacterium]
MLDMHTICQRLELHEGLRLQPYYCTKGKQTIGIGRNLDDNPITEQERKVVGDWSHGITRCGALYLLQHDVEKVICALKRRIKFFNSLDDERQYALIDMAFNLGIKGLMNFKKMLFFMQLKDYGAAAAECLNSRYARETKTRALRIAELIRSGVFKL